MKLTALVLSVFFSAVACAAENQLAYPPAEILAYAKTLKPRLTEIRRDLHRHPELGFKEFRTTAKIKEVLSSLPGIEILPLKMETGVVAELKGTDPSKGTVALRCDIDALPIQEDKPATHTYKSEVPDVMHACGHDGHVTINLGAAMLLSKFRPERTVRLLFQPAEETARSGALEFLACDVLKGVDEAWGFHLNATSDFGNVGWYDGTVMSGELVFTINVKGKSVHYSYPDCSVNPIVILSRISAELTGIKETIRATRPWEITLRALHSGDPKKTVTPPDGYLKASVFYHENEVRDFIRSKVEAITKSYCELYGATYEIDWKQGLDATYNEPKLGPVVRENAAALGLPLEHIFASMGGDDFGYYAQRLPAYYMTFGIRKGADFPLAHTAKFDFDEAVLPSAAAMFASCALRKAYPALPEIRNSKGQTR